MDGSAAQPETALSTRPGYFVRYGAMGHLGVFLAAEKEVYHRDAQVVVRTGRGLECGQVLAPCQWHPAESAPAGEILRRMGVEDHLLLARSRRRQAQALRQCEELLQQRGVPDVLVDAEYLLDGNTLVFYFLGQPSPQAENLLQELARRFEAQVRLQDFVRAAEEGCGPDCGTEQAAGCTGCHSSCTLAAMCHTSRKG